MNCGIQFLKTQAAFCISVVLILTIYYFPYLFEGKDFCAGDTTYYFEPQCRFIGESLRAGHFPLWNNLSDCGVSMLANPQPSIFFFPNYIFALLPFSAAMALVLLTHQLLAGASVFLLVRRWNLGEFAAWISGLSFAFCGYIFSIQSQYSIVTTCAWGPLFFWTICRIRDASSVRAVFDLFLGSFACYMVLSSGRFEIYVPIFLSVAIYMLLQLNSAKGNFDFAKRRFAWQTLSILLGLGLSTAFLLAQFEWLRLSPRAEGLSADEVFRWSANWYDLLCIVCAQPLGDLTQLESPFLKLVSSYANHRAYLQSALIGPVILTLSFWGLLDRTWKSRYLLIVALSIFLLLALGKNTPFAPLALQLLPSLSLMRYPVKMLFFVDIALILLAARGIFLLSAGGLAKKTIFVTQALWAGLLLFGFYALQVRVFFPEADSSIATAAQQLIANSVIQASGTALVFCFLCLLLEYGKIAKPLFFILTGVTVSASLLYPAINYVRATAPPGFFAKPRYCLELLKKIDPKPATARVLRSYSDAMSSKHYLERLTAGGITPTQAVIQYNRQTLFPNTNMDCDLKSSFGYDMAITGLHSKLAMGSMASSRLSRQAEISSKYHDVPLYRFCRITATKYLTAQIATLNVEGDPKSYLPILDPELFEPVLRDDNMNLLLYRIRENSKRVYLTTSVQNEEADFLSELSSSQELNLDPLSTVRLREAKNLSDSNSPTTLNSNGDRANISLDEPEHVSIDTISKSDSYLVLQDSYYPGWKAYIDGKSSEIYQANLINRAVKLPAGAHKVDFYFRPDCLYAGALAVGIVLASYTALALLCLRRKNEIAETQESAEKES